MFKTEYESCIQSYKHACYLYSDIIKGKKDDVLDEIIKTLKITEYTTQTLKEKLLSEDQLPKNLYNIITDKFPNSGLIEKESSTEKDIYGDLVTIMKLTSVRKILNIGVKKNIKEFHEKLESLDYKSIQNFILSLKYAGKEKEFDVKEFIIILLKKNKTIEPHNYITLGNVVKSDLGITDEELKNIKEDILDDLSENFDIYDIETLNNIINFLGLDCNDFLIDYLADFEKIKKLKKETIILVVTKIKSIFIIEDLASGVIKGLTKPTENINPKNIESKIKDICTNLKSMGMLE